MTKDIEKAYAALEDEKLGDNILAQISASAEEVVRRQQALEEAEALVKLRKEELRQVVEEELPALMEAAGQRKVTTRSGLSVSLDETIYANISQERAPEALAWLVDNGHEALIKNEYTIAFPKNSAAAAEAFEEYLNSNLRRKANLKHKTGVHPSTLSSWVREELADGREIPLDLLGVTRRKVCKVQ